MNVLALCGSLRQQSRSMALLQATHTLAHRHMAFSIYDGLGNLPLFNPDLEHAPPPAALALREAASWAHVVIIASPEYAHGVTGTIKNALDWLVGHIPFAGKPVAVFNPSHRAEHADEALKETLRTMAAQLIPGACLRIPATGCDLSAEQMASSASFSDLIESALCAMVHFVDNAAPAQV